METEVYDTVAVWQLEEGDLFRFDGDEYTLLSVDGDDPDEENFLVLTVESLTNTGVEDSVSLYEFDEVELIRYN